MMTPDLLRNRHTPHPSPLPSEGRGRSRRSLSPFLPISLSIFLLLSGCSSLTPERIQAIATVVGAAADVGAQIYLAQHPEARPAFDAVITVLGALQKAGNTNQDAFAEALSILPTNALSTAQTDLYVSNGLVVYDNQTKKVERVNGPLTQPVMRELTRGLKRAVGPRPPFPKNVSGSARARSAGFSLSLREAHGDAPRTA